MAYSASNIVTTSSAAMNCHRNFGPENFGPPNRNRQWKTGPAMQVGYVAIAPVGNNSYGSQTHKTGHSNTVMTATSKQ